MKSAILSLICFLFLSCSQRCSQVEIKKGPYALPSGNDLIEIRWETNAPTCAKVIVEEENSPRTYTGYEFTYRLKESWEKVIEKSEEIIHYNYSVPLKGLKRETRYNYRIPGDISGQIYSFLYFPQSNSFSFAVIGDTANFGENYEKNIKHLSGLKPDLVLHTGDLQYYSHLYDSWVKFFVGFDEIFSHSLFLPVRGNHENELKGEYENYFLRFFGFPEMDTSFHHSLEFGKTLFVVLDSEADPEGEKKFLESKLSDFNTRVTDGLKVVAFHRPPYTLSYHFPFIPALEGFVPIFLKYGVQIVFNGHNHVYERFEVNKVTYIVSGGGGATLYDADYQLKRKASGELTVEEEKIIDEIYPLRITASSSHHILYCEVGEEKLLGKAIDSSGQILDTFQLNYK